MSEYINRKILVDLVLSKLRFMGDARIMNQNDEKVLSEIDGYEKAINAVHELILDKGLIENVQPVKHGRWIEEYDCGYITPHCSECGETALTKEGTGYDYVYSSYCPHCGARMEREKNE